MPAKTFHRIKFNLSSIRGTFSFCLSQIVREEVGLSNRYWNLNIHVWHKTRSSRQRCSVRKGILRNFAKFTGKHLCQSLSFSKRETLAQVFSFEFCEISKNAFLTEHLWTTASVKLKLRSVWWPFIKINIKWIHHLGYLSEICRSATPFRKRVPSLGTIASYNIKKLK